MQYIDKLSHHEIAWTLSRADPTLLQFLRGKEPWLANELTCLHNAIPVSRTYRAFPQGSVSKALGYLPKGAFKSPGAVMVKAGLDFKNPGDHSDRARYVRPQGEQRAFYRRGSSQGVLGFRGTEVLAQDLAEGLEGLRHYPGGEAIASHFSALENRIILKQSVPLALSVGDALDEANVGAKFQARYFARYGELAPAPVPLLVTRLPRRAARHLEQTLRPLLRPFVFDHLEELTSDGLACLVSYHPHLPARMGRVSFQSVMGPYALHGFDRRTALLRAQRLDPQGIVGRWARLVARMFILETLPCTSSHVLDQCISSQHLDLHGGVTSLRSLQELSSVRSETELTETLMICVMELANAARDLTLRPLDNIEKYRKSFADAIAEPSMSLMSAWIFEELKIALDEERKTGNVDSRIAHFFTSPFGYGPLTEWLATLFDGGVSEQWKDMNDAWK
jgi:hypothetical protein